MCNVQELRGRDRKEREGKGDTGRLGRRKKTQETTRRSQETTRKMQGDAGDRREMQGNTGNQVARLSEE